ncbi:MAG: restriction endonuclease subunit S [Microcystis panniformis Mp_MB_F_20051200_S9]|uniref:Restriction endonuclease subunit S n=1 Tax=Microcystis panniformis Mp_MB_F_20051200_S9 TaxID=2486223 RepID=A0A552PSR0_9CHRO|nr:MAG: restriction endonuclease subunit S [Microcystis panniformis Mp_MB_F_20080800_S26D]TRV44325.1 MAG: restriction endonuclease subunit S [Microcystis panniformis Mp_GB_SS_20050300_S99]TRV55537.1 MAG: restriction endonuclease subunit S [Microcystis panniformis Mp_MB_F_20080800_S26]TRV55802.1 MAG: restriction endonuclease subunit S [Microcystis panniformis Mp_GB_SS_20050300_S99D]TRV57509.1 MAG: restriction endonuclease subunit S [Microcystis panniformis Mp_MB_F_20051200_S9D]TRV60035.1 MAG: r
MSKPTKLPEGWKLVSLGEVGTLINGDRGKNYPSQKDFVDNGVPFINAGHIQNGEIDFESMNFISRKRFDLLGSGKVKSGDILYCLRGSLGKTAIIKDIQEGAIASSLVIIRPSEQIRTDYFYRYLASPIGQAEIYKYDNGSSQPNLSAQSLKQYQLPLPPLEEQRRIAAILDKADGVRRKRKEAIRLTEELLKSTFLEMFGDPVTNPKGWRKISLGELLAEPLQNGAYFPKERYVEAPDGVEMVHMSDAFYNFVERGNLKRVQVTSEEFEKYKLILNDVLIARRSLNYEGSAKPCLISETAQPLIFESSLIRVRLNAEVIDSFFFFSYMLEPRARSAYVFPNVTKSTISGINQAGLKRISVLAPPMSIQKKYRDIYETILGTQSNYQKDYENIDNLFNSLLQRAFRGEL